MTCKVTFISSQAFLHLQYVMKSLIGIKVNLAFLAPHLSPCRILGFRIAPPVVGRKIDLNALRPVTSQTLLSTYFLKGW